MKRFTVLEPMTLAQVADAIFGDASRTEEAAKVAGVATDTAYLSVGSVVEWEESMPAPVPFRDGAAVRKLNAQKRAKKAAAPYGYRADGRTPRKTPPK